MKTIIAGSRGASPRHVDEALRLCPWQITSVLSGGAKGADRYGERWAKYYGIPLDICPANWDRHGRNAGRIRNCEMGALADALVAVWDGDSPGTRHMINHAREIGLKVHVHRYFDMVYAWDNIEKCCYATERKWVTKDFTLFGDVLDEGTLHKITGLPQGTQSDLDRACRLNYWWQPWWDVPRLGLDPIPF